MSDVNKVELRRLASAATGGDWEFRLGTVRTLPDSDGYVAVAIAPDAPKSWRPQRDANLEYIAAAKPAVVLALLDREAQAICEASHAAFQRDEAYAECARLRAELDAIRGQEPSLDKWAEYKAKFCGCKDASRHNSCRGLATCQLPIGHPERKVEYHPPQQPDAVSVPRELVQEALEMAIDDAGEHQCSPCFNPTRQRVLDAQVERWRALLSTRQAEEGE